MMVLYMHPYIIGDISIICDASQVARYCNN